MWKCCDMGRPRESAGATRRVTWSKSQRWKKNEERTEEAESSPATGTGERAPARALPAPFSRSRPVCPRHDRPLPSTRSLPSVPLLSRSSGPPPARARDRVPPEGSRRVDYRSEPGALLLRGVTNEKRETERKRETAGARRATCSSATSLGAAHITKLFLVHRRDV
ncbi:hypothetical protein PUN28_005919 [Cardiocondyla obscurior]|uniref:Uncharacterized protein n=1 Tax=Cardiocondyla obscurior TaxID=286306 RepID=A0AAW2G7Y1_9HYME